MTGADDDHTAEQVEELARANAESNATMMSLVAKVQQDAAMRERKVDLLEKGLQQTHRLLIMVGIALVLMVILGIVNAVNITEARKQAAVTAGIAKNAQGTYALLLDCINSRGECGKQNAEQNKRVLDEIKRYELTGFYCARTNPLSEDPNGDKFLACMDRLYVGGPKLSGR